jgi:hypothetical protein
MIITKKGISAFIRSPRKTYFDIFYIRAPYENWPPNNDFTGGQHLLSPSNREQLKFQHILCDLNGMPLMTTPAIFTQVNDFLYLQRLGQEKNAGYCVY